MNHVWFQESSQVTFLVSFTRLRLAHVSRFYAIFSSLILTQSQINIHVFR